MTIIYTYVSFEGERFSYLYLNYSNHGLKITYELFLTRLLKLKQISDRKVIIIKSTYSIYVNK